MRGSRIYRENSAETNREKTAFSLFVSVSGIIFSALPFCQVERLFLPLRTDCSMQAIRRVRWLWGSSREMGRSFLMAWIR
jgi:hypothetical protein